jgi:hypothetical protein
MWNLWKKARLACMTQTPDAVNQDIWAFSPAIHRQASFREELLAHAGSIGARQAMLDPAIHPTLRAGSVAPWVPDLLGEEWTHPNAIFVVGSALAGFIEGYSSRDHVMSSDAYLTAQDWTAFQRVFLRDVVAGDGDHYEKLCPLINHRSRFAVFDIARCSLVVRATVNGRRKDENVDTRMPGHRAVFARYAEHPKSREWTTARLVGSRARMIIALGFTAEYGLVRLFDDMGMRVRDSVTRSLWRERRLRNPDNWTYSYPGGSRDRSLRKRYDPPAWWEIEDPATGNPRWALVPVVHPSAWGGDPGYRRSRKLIAAARRQVRRWPTT